MEHKHREPNSLWGEVGALLLFYAVIVNFVLIFAILLGYTNEYRQIIVPNSIIILSLVEACITLIAIPIGAVWYRESHMMKGSSLLKKYDDGCIEMGDLFWKKGGEIFKINEKLSDFEKGIEIEKSITTQIIWNEDYVHITVPIKLTIKMFGFDPAEYYRRIVENGKKSFEEYAKFMFEMHFPEEEIAGILSLYANQEITKKDALQKLARVISFPEKYYFETFLGTKISFGDPVYEACSGSLCSAPNQ